MTQQIRNILAQNCSKTKKIQQLHLLGIAKRHIAELVTNGNYGQVWNAINRMNLLDVPSTPSTPIIDYTFTRKFGVEIEAYNCLQSTVIRALREEGIEVRSESYNHTTRPHWKIVSDSSLRGNRTFELVSPILEGEAGLKELKKVCIILEAQGVKVNSSCGLHIHFDAANFALQTWKNVALTYKNIESVIDSFMPSSRRDNRYCRALRAVSTQKIQNATSIQQLQASAFSNDRYYKINTMSYNRHKTIEFRQHAGSVNHEKITNWILFLNGLVTFAEQQRVENISDINSIPFIDEDLKFFFRQRKIKVNR
ncbi:MAG: amidoligase family protein [Tannerellaceae bacterium]|nr:amidoligase family protein [Tannerellaceae bacterium]